MVCNVPKISAGHMQPLDPYNMVYMCPPFFSSSLFSFFLSKKKRVRAVRVGATAAMLIQQHAVKKKAFVAR